MLNLGRQFAFNPVFPKHGQFITHQGQYDFAGDIGYNVKLDKWQLMYYKYISNKQFHHDD